MSQDTTLLAWGDFRTAVTAAIREIKKTAFHPDADLSVWPAAHIADVMRQAGLLGTGRVRSFPIRLDVEGGLLVVGRPMGGESWFGHHVHYDDGRAERQPLKRETVEYALQCLREWEDYAARQMGLPYPTKTDGEGVVAAVNVTPSPNLADLEPAVRAAYTSFIAINTRMPHLRKDKAIWKHLREYGGYDDDFEVPDSFDTFARYLRRARLHMNDSKNRSRSGRTGRSIFRHDQL